MLDTREIVPADWQSFDPSGPIVPLPVFRASDPNQIEYVKKGRMFVDRRADLIDLAQVDWSSNAHDFVSTQLHGLTGIGALLTIGKRLPSDIENTIGRHILDWARSSLGNRSINPRAWHEGTTMKRLSNLLHTLNYTRHHGELPSLNERTILYLIDANAAFLLDEPDIYKRGNHGIRQDMMLAATAISLPKHPRAGEMLRLAESRLAAAAVNQFTPSGIWLEQAPGYVNYMLRLMVDIVRLAEASDDFNPDQFVSNFSASRGFLLSVLFPNGTIPPVGRSSSSKVSSVVARPNEITKHLRNSSGLASFPDYGHAVIRGRDDFYLLFIASKMAGKRHSDELSFLLYNHGRLWITEGGQKDTKPNGMSRYLVSPLAHNTYVLNGSFLGDRKKPKLEARLTGAHETEDGGFHLSGRSDRFITDAAFTRDIRVDAAFEMVRITDRLASVEPVDSWEGRLQIPGDLRVRVRENEIVAIDRESGRRMRVTFRSSVPLSFSSCRGQRGPLCGWGRSPSHGPVTTVRWACEDNADIEIDISWH